VASTLPQISIANITFGDASGFLALILVGLSSIFMLVRPLILKVTKDIAAIRVAHITISTLAGVFMIVHVVYLFGLPTTVSLDLGYISVAVSVAVWLTGTAFLERLRDSLFFHGTLASALVGLVMVHAATSSVNIPAILSEIILAATLMLMLTNATFHLTKAIPRAPSPKRAKT